MALQGFAGFDGVNNATDVVTGPLTAYNSVGVSGGAAWTLSIDTVNYRGASGKCIKLVGGGTMSSQTSAQAVKAYNAVITTAIGGMALKANNLAALGTGAVFLGFWDGTTVQVSMKIDAAGTVTVYRGDPRNGALLGTASGSISPTSYNFFEMLVTISNTVGVVTLNINGANVLSLTGVNNRNTANSQVTSFGIGAISGATGSYSGDFLYADDLYIADTTGGAPYNTFLGDCHVTTIFPTSNNTVAWTPLASTNVSQIQETAMDSDTSYNSAATAPLTDIFNQPGLSIVPASVLAVQVKVAARVDNAGVDQLQQVLVSGATTALGTAVNVPSTYRYLDNFWTTDPNTGLAWVYTDVNTVTFGYKRSA